MNACWLLLAMVVGGANAWRFLGFVCDDAVISFRSVENFALGHGLVWNAGERLETFTNLGLVLLLALARLLGLDVFDAASAIGWSAAVGTIAALWWLARELDLGRAAVAPAIFVASSTTLMGQAGSGLETTLCALLVTLGLARSLQECRSCSDGRVRRHGIGMALLAAAVLARPDSACVLFGMLVCKPFLLVRSERRRALVADGLAALLLLGAEATFRLAYYGVLLPNPVHAKVGLGTDPQVLKHGFKYLIEWSDTDFGLPVLVAGLVVAAIVNGKARVLAMLCAGWCLYVVLSGGDHMAYARFFAPMLAVFAVTITAAWARWFTGSRWMMFAGIAFTAALAGKPMMLSVSNGNVPAKNHAHETYRREIGEWCAEQAAARGGRLVVACNPVGYIGYSGGPGVRVVDMLGLCDAHIARRGRRDTSLIAGHQVGDGAYVLAQRPDYVLLGTATAGDLWQRQDAGALLREIRAAGVDAWAKANGHQFLVSEREMLANDEMYRDYVFLSVALPSGRPLHLLQRQP